MIVFRKTDGDHVPTICACSAHHKGSWLRWADVEKVGEGSQPIIYVANGSHANYFYGPGLYPTAPPLARMAIDLLKKPGKLIDYTMSWEKGDRRLVEAKVIPSSPANWTGEWRWLNQQGRWGSKGKWLDFEFGDSAPVGPPQGGSRWDTPFSWIDTNCTRAPSEDESRVPSRIEP